jgi:hypothetical protein
VTEQQQAERTMEDSSKNLLKQVEPLFKEDAVLIAAFEASAPSVRFSWCKQWQWLSAFAAAGGEARQPGQHRRDGDAAAAVAGRKGARGGRSPRAACMCG